jgi:putative ABC transport system permease protein
MDSKTAKESLGVEGVSIFAISMKPDATQSDHENVKAIAMQDQLLFQSAADLRSKLDKIINSVVACLWGILALGFLVGAFGIANTLTMNVLEQTRELAMLRVVAMTRKQVRKTILAQAIIIGFIGLTIGILGGVSGSYISNLCSTKLIGHSIAFSLQPELLGICFAAGLAVVMAAAWMPAIRASRLNLLIALQYE